MELRITSPAFKGGARIPLKYTCEGINVSPPLQWNQMSGEVKSVVLIADDPDAPSKTWAHWVLYNLDPQINQLDEDFSNSVRGGALKGRNDFGNVGYGGPCPPANQVHRYYFRLYALDKRLDVEPGATRDQVLKAMSGSILGQTELIGTYSRALAHAAH